LPFKSLAQEGYLHSHPEILGKKDLAEWDAATRGKHLPKHVKSYEHGGEVTETGLALLHKGEHVVSKEETKNMPDLKELMGAALGSGKAKKKKAKLHMNIHRMTDGKFHVEHSYRGGEEPMPEGSEHAPANLAELKAHMDAHFGPEEEPEGTPAPEAS
jgi:hypothetical protein